MATLQCSPCHKKYKTIRGMMKHLYTNHGGQKLGEIR